MNVNLEWYEVSRAALVGVSRNVEALRRGLQNRMQINDEWSIHILGALGECAFCKATNRYWSAGVNTFKGGDVGDSIQVRTRSRHDYDLIVRDGDKDADVFVLVTGGPTEFAVHGWMLGRDAKQPKYLANYGKHGDAFFVPKRDLNDAAALVCGDN
jgi:hypothetical protein